MKYLCKKKYENYFIPGELYYGDNIIYLDNSMYKHDRSGIESKYRYFKIDEYRFVIDNFVVESPKFEEYFYSQKELRKIKLKKLYEVSM